MIGQVEEKRAIISPGFWGTPISESMMNYPVVLRVMSRWTPFIQTFCQ